MHRLLSAIVFSASCATGAVADTFTASNHVAVAPDRAGFTVLGDNGHGHSGVWCAAAEYAQKRMGAEMHNRLFVTDGSDWGFGQSGFVKFALTSKGLPTRPVTLLATSFVKPGGTLTVGHAITFCHDAKVIMH